MKNFITSISLLFISQAGFTQQMPSAKKHLTSQEYLQRSNEQIIFGSVLLAGGTALVLIGVNTGKNATSPDFTGIGLEGLGILVAGGCIPYLSSAAIIIAKEKKL